MLLNQRPTSDLGRSLPLVFTLWSLMPEDGGGGGARRPPSWGVWFASQPSFSTEPNSPMESASRRMDQV